MNSTTNSTLASSNSTNSTHNAASKSFYLAPPPPTALESTRIRTILIQPPGILSHIADTGCLDERKVTQRVRQLESQVVALEGQVQIVRNDLNREHLALARIYKEQ